MSAAVAASPAVRRLFRRLTLLWGLVILVKGTITFWLLTSLSTVDFVLIKGGAILTLTMLAAATTVAWSVVVAARRACSGPAEARDVAPHQSATS